MASGSRGRGQADALSTLRNPDLEHLPAVDLVLHLHRDDRSGSDFADVALVLAVRERRLAEAEARVRAVEVVADGLRDTIRALELRVANAEALARDRTVRAGGEEEEESQAEADDHLAASDIGVAEPELTTSGELRARDLEIVVPELGAGKICPGGVCFEADVEATPAEDEDNVFSPIPLMTILPSPDELIEEREAERVVVGAAVPSSHEVSEAIAGKRKEPAADLFLPLDELRKRCRKVAEEETHEEDMTVSPRRRSQGEQPGRATKKAGRQKGTSVYRMGVSFHKKVLKALMEKQDLLRKKKEEALTKEAAATTSKSVAAEDDSDDSGSSQN